MVSVYPNLSDRLHSYNVSYDNLARILNMSESLLSLKMQGLSPWKLWEVVQICILLETPDVNILFLLDSNT